MVGNVLTILALILVIYRLAHYDIDYSVLLSGRNVALLAALSLAYAISVLMMPLSWSQIIHFLGYKEVAFRDAQYICVRSNLMKYIPGNVMQYVGRNEIAVQYDLNHAKIALSTVLDILAYAAGIGILSLICYGQGIQIFLENYQIPWGMVLLAGGLVLAAGAALLFIFREKVKKAIREIRWRRYLLCLLIYVGIGLYNGGIYAAVLRWIVQVPLPSSLYFTVTGAFLLSWLIGFITPGAPGGIGIRETMAVLFLQGILPQEQVLLSIVIYRVVNTLGDVAAYAICLAGKELRPGIKRKKESA